MLIAVKVVLNNGAFIRKSEVGLLDVRKTRFTPISTTSADIADPLSLKDILSKARSPTDTETCGILNTIDALVIYKLFDQRLKGHYLDMKALKHLGQLSWSFTKTTKVQKAKVVNSLTVDITLPSVPRIRVFPPFVHFQPTSTTGESK